MYFFKSIGLGACLLAITTSALPLKLAETVCKPCFQDQIIKYTLISSRYPEQEVVAPVLPSAEISIPPTRHSSPTTVDTAVKYSSKLPESEKECINVLLPGVVKMYKKERALSVKAIASHRFTHPTNDTHNPLAMYDLSFGLSLLLPMTKASHTGPNLKKLSPQEKCVASLLPAIMIVSMQHEARVKGTLFLHKRDHSPLTSQQKADIASINALYPELQRFLREDEEKKQRQHDSHSRDGLTRQQASDINTLETLYPGLTHGMTEAEAKKDITTFEALFPNLLLVASPKEDVQHFENMLGQELPEETNMYVTTHAYTPLSNHKLTFRTSHVSSSSSSSSSSSPQSTRIPGGIAETKPKRQLVINSMDFKGGCMRNAECHKWVHDHCHDFKKRQDTLPTFAEYKHFCMLDVKCTQWIAKHCVV